RPAEPRKRVPRPHRPRFARSAACPDQEAGPPMSQVSQAKSLRVQTSEPSSWLVAATRLGFLALIVLLWWIASINVARNLIPSPSATFQAAGGLLQEGRLQTAFVESLTCYLSGYGLAIAVAIPLGVVMGACNLLGRTLETYVYALSATPRVAFIPLIIVLLGLGSEAKVFIVYLGAVMPILINTFAGVRQSDPALIELVRLVGAGRMRIFNRHVH